MGASFGRVAGLVAKVVRGDACAADVAVARAVVWDFFVSEPSTILSFVAHICAAFHSILHPRAGLGHNSLAAPAA